jgi:hypothetical protein
VHIDPIEVTFATSLHSLLTWVIDVVTIGFAGARSLPDSLIQLFDVNFTTQKSFIVSASRFSLKFKCCTSKYISFPLSSFRCLFYGVRKFILKSLTHHNLSWNLNCSIYCAKNSMVRFTKLFKRSLSIERVVVPVVLLHCLFIIFRVEPLEVRCLNCARGRP